MGLDSGSCRGVPPLSTAQPQLAQQQQQGTTITATATSARLGVVSVRRPAASAGLRHNGDKRIGARGCES